MTNLNYDPFPNAKNDDIVDRALIGRELVLYAKLRAPVDSLRLGTAIRADGHSFALTKVTEQIATQGENAQYEIEGSDWLTYIEPITILAEMRRKLDEKQN